MKDTLKKPEVSDEAMQKFVKSLEGLDASTRAQKLQEFAVDSLPNLIAYDPEDRQKKGQTIVNLSLTPEMLDSLIERSVTGARDAITELGQKNLGVSRADAQGIAERTVEEHMHKRVREQKENRIIADIFQQQFFASRGESNSLQDAYKKEADYLGRDTIATSKELRAMTLGTDTSGGHLAPELWITRVYEALAVTGLARRLATLVEMTTETLKLPKITAGFTANILGELSAATPAQPTLAQFQLTPQKIVVLTKAFSHELMVNADPALVPILTHLATIAFSRKEDEMMFVGSDATVTGWLENTANVVTMGTGEDAITDIDFDDFADLENALDEQYSPDADVQNSGGIGGEARFFANKKAWNVLQKLKGNDNYYWGDVGGVRPRSLWGHPYHRVPDMPSAPAAATKFAAYGNPKYTYFGYKPAIFVDLLKEATIDSVDMASSAGMALRLIEYVDTKTIDDNSLATLKTAA